LDHVADVRTIDWSNFNHSRKENWWCSW